MRMIVKRVFSIAMSVILVLSMLLEPVSIIAAPEDELGGSSQGETTATNAAPEGGDEDPQTHVEETPVLSEWNEKDVSLYVYFYVKDPDPEIEDDEYIVLGKAQTENGTYNSGWRDATTVVGNFRIPQAILISSNSTQFPEYAGKRLLVKEIGPYCFNGASGLGAVEIPEGIESIGEYAFSKCGIGDSNHGVLNIPASVTYIGKYAFKDCAKLTTVTATDSDTLLTIDEYAFSNGAGSGIQLHLTGGVSIDRPLNVGSNAFYDSHVASLDIPRAESIGEKAFYGSALNAFEIPASLTYIGARAFSHNTGSLAVTYQETDETDLPELTIGTYAFANEGDSDNGVVSVALDPNKAVRIQEAAFRYNHYINYLSLGNAVEVGKDAFKFCGENANTTSSGIWPRALEIIGESAFENCKLLGTADLTAAKQVSKNAFAGSTLTEVTLPASSAIFGTAVFGTCMDLTSVTIPETWETVPTDTFKSAGLQTVILSGATKIGNSAFFDNKSLVSVDMPYVPEIGTQAFYGCSALQNLVASSATTLGKEAFKGDTALQYAYLPAVTVIPQSCFHSDSALKTVYMPEVITVGNSSFYGCTALLNTEDPTATGYDPASEQFRLEFATTIGPNAFESCSSLKHIQLDAATVINQAAFYNCTSLQTAELDAIQTIGNSAFKNCTSLTNVDMETVQTVGDYAFQNDTALTAANMPKVTTIGQYAFQGDTALTAAIMSNAIAIGDNAFRKCSLLSEVNIASLQTVGSYAFAETGTNATEIQPIEFPLTITSIKDNAFYKCQLIGAVDMTDWNLNELNQGAFQESSITEVKLPIQQPKSFKFMTFDRCKQLTAVTIPEVEGGYSLPYKAFYQAGSSAVNKNISIGPLKNVGYEAFSGSHLLDNSDLTIVGTVDHDAFSNIHVQDVTCTGATLNANVFNSATTGDISLNNTRVYGDAFVKTKTGKVDIFGGSVLETFAFHKAKTGSVSLENSTANSCAFAEAEITVTAPLANALVLNGATVKAGAFAKGTINGNVLITGNGTKLEDGAFAAGVYDKSEGKFVYLAADIPAELETQDWDFTTPVTFGKLTITGSNAKIGNYAFLGTGFQSLEIKSSATGVEIGNYAFSKTEQPANKALAEGEQPLVVPDDTLTEVIIGTSDILLGNYVFNNRVKLSAITLPSEEPANLGSFLFANCKAYVGNGGRVDIPAGWTYLPDGFFYGCNGITYLYLPESLTNVGAYVYTSKGTPGHNVTVFFDSGDGIRINDNAFRGIVGEERDDHYSYLDIYLLKKPKYSVQGFAGGWGAWETEKKEYWIHWLLMNGDPDCFFEEPRIELSDDYKEVTGSNQSTFVEIAVKIGSAAINTGWVKNPAYFDQTTGYSNTLFDDEGKNYKVDYAIKERDDGTYDFYSISRITLKVEDDITDWDYQYSVFKRLFNRQNSPCLMAEDVANYLDPVTYEFNIKQYIIDYVQNHETSGVPDVESIGEGAFRLEGKEAAIGFNHIYIPDTVTQIASGAFMNQGNLKYLTAIDGTIQTLDLDRIGNAAFANCQSLERFELASNQYSCAIGKEAFRNCRSLAGIDWSRVATIGDYAFAECSSLASISMGAIGSIGSYAFTACNGLQEINLGLAGVIGDHAFDGCPVLSHGILGMVGIIGDYAFANCNALQAMEIDAVVCIGDHAFSLDKELTRVYIGNIGASVIQVLSTLAEKYNLNLGSLDVTGDTIGEYAFNDCSNLNDFLIAQGHISKIAQYAFKNAAIWAENSNFQFGIKGDTQQCVVDKITGYAFSQAEVGTLYFDKVTQLDGNAFSNTGKNANSIIEINEMTNGTIINEAFYKCKVGHFKVNSGVITSISNAAFDDMPYVTDIQLCDVTDFGTGSAVVVMCPNLTSLTFGNVQTVGGNACSGVSSLQTLKFADVKTIGNSAFYQCTGLTNVVISGAISVGDNAFAGAGATNAQKMDLPDTLKTIGDNAFKNSKLIGFVLFPSGADAFVGSSAFAGSTVSEIQFQTAPPKTMGENMFGGCNNLTTVTFPTTEDGGQWATIPSKMFNGCTSLENLDIGSVTKVEEQAFKGCTKLMNVNLRRVETVQEYAFAECGNDPLNANAELPSTVTSVGKYAFTGNNFIKKAQLSIAGVSEGAFYNSTLSEMDWPVVSPIGSAAFAKTKLSSIVIPDTWAQIPAYTFAGCETAEGIEVNGNPTIMTGAFSGCTNVKVLTINGDSVIEENAFSDITVQLNGETVSFGAAFAPRAIVAMDKVTQVNTAAFRNCINIDNVSMNKLRKLGDEAFKNCSGLTTVTMEKVQTIGDSAFDGCTSLTRLNSQVMYLQNHTVYRQTNPNYTEEKGWMDAETQYSSAIAEAAGDMQLLLEHNPSAVSSDAISAYFLYEGYPFGMCRIPNTVLSVGANVFRGCPIKNLYIADVNVKYENANDDKEPFVNEGENLFNENAFNGIGCQLAPNGEVLKDANGNNVLVDGQDYVYIFVQHSLNKLANAPWASNAMIEWDDGIIGSAEYGLYYRYSTGTIVSVYDQREVVETPETLPDALKDQHPITGFEPRCFLGSNVNSLILNETIDIVNNIQQGAFHIPGETPPAVPNIYILQYAEPEKEAAIENALKDSDGNVATGVHVEWLEDPEIHFPVYSSVDAAPDEEVIFGYTFEQESSAAYEVISSASLTAAAVYEGNAIDAHSLLLGMIQQQLRYGADGIQTRSYIPNDTTNGGQSFTYRFTQEMSNTDWYGCDIPVVYCKVTFTRDNVKSSANFSINYTPVFEFYTLDENGTKVQLKAPSTDADFTFVNAGAKPIYLVYVNSAPAGYTATFADGMLEGTSQAVAIVRKYPVVIQGGALTCTDTEGNVKIFAGWALTENATNPEPMFDTPYMTFKEARENVQTKYAQYIQTYNGDLQGCNGEEVIYLYPVWKTPASKTISTNFSMTLDKVIDGNQVVNLDTRYLPKKYGYNFTGYFAVDDNSETPLLQYIDGNWIWNYSKATAADEDSRYAYKLGDNDYRWYDGQINPGDEIIIMAKLTAGWNPITSPRYKVTLKNGNFSPDFTFYTEYNSSAIFSSAIGAETVTLPTEGAYYTAAEGGVKVIDHGALVPNVTGWTTAEIDGEVRWVSSLVLNDEEWLELYFRPDDGT